MTIARQTLLVGSVIGPLLLALGGCSFFASHAVDGARIVAADPGEWTSHGRNYAEQRYSPPYPIR